MEMMREELTAASLWQRYETAKEYIRKIDLVERTDKAYRFYNGDQWAGLKAGGEELPIYNFIKPIIKYKVAVVAQNSMGAVYSPMGKRNSENQRACELLTKNFMRRWELAKMDSVSWQMIKAAAIQGDSYLYFGEGDDLSAAQMIENTNIFLADERSDDIQSQKYIIIRERRFVQDVIRDGEAAGLTETDLAMIVSDENELDMQVGEKQEQDFEAEEGKATCLLYLYKDEEGFVHIIRSTKNVIYTPDKSLRATDSQGNALDIGLRMYPILNFIWEQKQGSSRGVGEVEFLIPNQLEVNKTLARMVITIKQGAFPRLAYAKDMIVNPADLDKVGGKIAVKGSNVNRVNDLLSFVNPSPLSPDARNLVNELVAQSRELAGAGDAATGSIDPTQASGTAIIAVRDQTALPLNEQLARFRQFVEDMALLWYDLWIAYNPNGIEVETDEGEGYVRLSPELLRQMRVNVRVDVSANNPFSRFAKEQALENLFRMGAITFEEYVDALDDDSAAPKGKLEDILAKRKQQAEMAQSQSSAMAGKGAGNILPAMLGRQGSGNQEAAQVAMLNQQAQNAGSRSSFVQR